jgi:hypothetical protein
MAKWPKIANNDCNQISNVPTLKRKHDVQLLLDCIKKKSVASGALPVPAGTACGAAAGNVVPQITSTVVYVSYLNNIVQNIRLSLQTYLQLM